MRRQAEVISLVYKKFQVHMLWLEHPSFQVEARECRPSPQGPSFCIGAGLRLTELQTKTGRGRLA